MPKIGVCEHTPAEVLDLLALLHFLHLLLSKEDVLVFWRRPRQGLLSPLCQELVVLACTVGPQLQLQLCLVFLGWLLGRGGVALLFLQQKTGLNSHYIQEGLLLCLQDPVCLVEIARVKLVEGVVLRGLQGEVLPLLCVLKEVPGVELLSTDAIPSPEDSQGVWEGL